MHDIERILVVSRSTKYCYTAVHQGVALAKKTGAKLYILHTASNPFSPRSWKLPLPSSMALAEEYKRMQDEIKLDLDLMIETEQASGMKIETIIKDDGGNEEIFKMVKQEKIDLVVLLAHEESHLEHFLFGRENEEIIRKLPCSVLLVKKEPGPVDF